MVLISRSKGALKSVDLRAKVFPRRSAVRRSKDVFLKFTSFKKCTRKIKEIWIWPNLETFDRRKALRSFLTNDTRCKHQGIKILFILLLILVGNALQLHLSLHHPILWQQKIWLSFHRGIGMGLSIDVYFHYPTKNHLPSLQSPRMELRIKEP